MDQPVLASFMDEFVSNSKLGLRKYKQERKTKQKQEERRKKHELKMKRRATNLRRAQEIAEAQRQESLNQTARIQRMDSTSYSDDSSSSGSDCSSSDEESDASSTSSLSDYDKDYIQRNKVHPVCQVNVGSHNPAGSLSCVTKERHTMSSPHHSPTHSNHSSPTHRRTRSDSLDSSSVQSIDLEEGSCNNKMLHLAGRRVMAMSDTVKKMQAMHIVPLVPITTDMRDEAYKVKVRTIDEAAVIAEHRMRVINGYSPPAGHSRSQPSSPIHKTGTPKAPQSNECAARNNRQQLLQGIAHNYIINAEKERNLPHFARRTLSQTIATAKRVDGK